MHQWTYKAKQISKRGKMADITSILKKEDPLDKTSFRYISIVPAKMKRFRYKLEIKTNTAIQRLKHNEVVANPTKFLLMFLSKYKNIEKKICLLMEKFIKSSDTVELLEITLYKNICVQRANDKTKASFRISGNYECYVCCFSLRWSINSWNNYCIWN